MWRRPVERIKEIALTALKLTDEEIKTIGPVLQRISWADPETRERLQKYGVNILPVNFYSSTPSFEEIKSSFEYNEEEPPYLSEQLFDPDFLNETLRQLSEYSSEFNAETEGDVNHPRNYFWKNGQFGYSDAMAYYCFIRKLKPKTILEIGSGFSTLIAIEAVRKNQAGTIVCVEPFPRPFLKGNKSINLIERKAQDLTADFLNETLQDGDILFIDSTHTVKTGSDCNDIYLRRLPQIKHNITVHVHDVFLPFGLPLEWLKARQIFWTEQYLLMAFLLDNPKARVCFGSTYHHKLNNEALTNFMGGKYLPGGGSFWFEYRGRP